MKNPIKNFLNWLNKPRFIEICFGEIDHETSESLGKKATNAIFEMKKAVVMRKIQDYYETVDCEKIEVPAFIKAEKELERIINNGQLDYFYAEAESEEFVN